MFKPYQSSDDIYLLGSDSKPTLSHNRPIDEQHPLQSSLQFTHGQSLESKATVQLIYSWGKNKDGQLGIGPVTDERCPLPTPSRGIKGDAIYIASARQHSVVLTKDGRIYLAGSLQFGKIGIESTANRFHTFRLHKMMEKYTIVKIACGDFHTAAVTNDGQLFSWGGTLWEKTGHKSQDMSQILKEEKVVDVACGDFHTVALTSKGVVYSWGGGKEHKNKGQLGHGDKKDTAGPKQIGFFKHKKIVKIACGQYHTMVMTNQREIYAFGEGKYGQLGTGQKDDCAIPAKVTLTLQAQVDDYFKNDSYNDAHIIDFSLGGKHSLLLSSTGELYVCGYGSQGQLGMGAGFSSNIFSPVLVKAFLGKKVIKIAAGANHSLALTSKNHLYACGYNAYNQLGLQDRSEKPVTLWTHVVAMDGRNMAMIFAGGDQSWVVLDGHQPHLRNLSPPSPLKQQQQHGDDSHSNRSLSPDNTRQDIVHPTPLLDLCSGHRLQLLVSSEVQAIHRFIHFVVRESCRNAKRRLDDYKRAITEFQQDIVLPPQVKIDTSVLDVRGQQMLPANARGFTILTIVKPSQDTQLLMKIGKPVKINNVSLTFVPLDRLVGNGKVHQQAYWLLKFMECFDDVLENVKFVQLMPSNSKDKLRDLK